MEACPCDDADEILEGLNEEILSAKLIGHERMRRLWLLYELDPERAIDVAGEMVNANQLGSLPKYFLRQINADIPAQ